MKLNPGTMELWNLGTTVLPHEAETQARGDRREDRRRLLVAGAGVTADRLRRVTVGDVEQINEQARADTVGEVHGLLTADIEDPDVVFAVRVRRLEVDGRARGGDAGRERQGGLPRVVHARLVPQHRRDADAPRRIV